MSLVESHDVADKPPKPTEIRRKLKFYRAQAIGVPLIALFPILALLGVFDSSCVVTHASSANLALDVSYPSKLRFKSDEPVEIVVRNTGPATLHDVDVSISRPYVEKFMDVVFEPNVTEIRSAGYVVSIEELPANESRTVTLDLKANSPGTVVGVVTASAGREEATAHLKTFVYP